MSDVMTRLGLYSFHATAVHDENAFHLMMTDFRLAFAEALTREYKELHLPSRDQLDGRFAVRVAKLRLILEQNDDKPEVRHLLSVVIDFLHSEFDYYGSWILNSQLPHLKSVAREETAEDHMPRWYSCLMAYWSSVRPGVQPLLDRAVEAAPMSADRYRSLLRAAMASCCEDDGSDRSVWRCWACGDVVVHPVDTTTPLCSQAGLCCCSEGAWLRAAVEAGVHLTAP